MTTILGICEMHGFMYIYVHFVLYVFEGAGGQTPPLKYVKYDVCIYDS